MTNPAKPSDARQVEGGVKFQPRGGNSVVTASVFQINQTDVLVNDAASTAHQDGEVRSRGATSAGAIDNNSFYTPSYTLLDAELRFDYRHTLFATNATNLADTRDVATCYSLNARFYGYARNVIGSAKYHF